MKTHSISDLRNHLPSVIDDVTRTNEPVIIERYGKPVASIIPFKDETSTQSHHPLRGQSISVASDFDDPIPDLWNAVGTQ